LILYRVINLLKTSIVIEDLGINLSAGGSINISADAHARSEDLRRLQRYLRIEIVYIRPLIQTSPIASAPVISSVPSSINQDNFAVLNTKMNDIITLLKKVIDAPTHTIIHTTQVREAMLSSCDGDPTFIPNSIIPLETETHINFQKSDISKDISRSRDSLKKLREKQ
jgi:hypothetical protein